MQHTGQHHKQTNEVRFFFLFSGFFRVVVLTKQKKFELAASIALVALELALDLLVDTLLFPHLI